MGLRALSLAIALALGVAACANTPGGTPLTGDDGEDDASAFDGSHDVELPNSDALVLVDSGSDDSSMQSDVVIPGSCMGQPDGTVCVQSHDPCYADAVCAGGLCGGLSPKPNGTVCKQASDPCKANGVCTAGQCGNPTPRPDGYNYQPGDDTARCCGGSTAHTDTNTNCGACGIQCNAVNGESCQILGGHYFCRGCIASSACWSHCCSLSFSPASCAASDCAGNCSATYCPAGTHCVTGNGTSSDYCAY
jgi:hypothetical protein